MTDPATPGGQTRSGLLDLVKTDYEATRGLIDGVVRTSLALRGVGVTLVIALLGFAAERTSVPVSLCALAAIAVFCYLDAYHGWLYADALTRAKQLEKILALRYKELERDGADPATAEDLDDALAAHRFGQYSNLRRFRLSLLKRARPKAVYFGLYGSLVILAVVTTVYSAIDC